MVKTTYFSITVLSLLFILTVGCKSTDRLIEEHTYNLYPVKYDNLYGYADFHGNQIIKPQFTEASLFINKIAAVKVDNLYGYIKNTGEWIVKPKYTSADHFHLKYDGTQNKDGTNNLQLIAKVNDGSGDYYVDTKGKPIKSLVLSNEVGGCIGITSKLDEYSIQNADGTYEITYQYLVTTSDTSGYKVFDTTHLRLDTIIEYDRHFALLKKDSMYTIYYKDISLGFDAIKNQRAIIQEDSIYHINLQFVYEDVKFREYLDETIPTYILKKNGKWGIQSYGQEPTIPFVYYDIQQVKYSNDYLVEFAKGKFGHLSIVRDSNDPSKSVIVEHFKR